MPCIRKGIKDDLYIRRLKERSMLGKLQETAIENLLSTQVMGRLACHADGETYVIPISYAYDGKYIYCHTQEGKKTRMMRANPKVCFEVDELKTMANWQSVVVQGVFEEVKRREDRNAAMETLLNRYLPIMSSITTHLGEHWPFHPNDLTEIKGVVFRILVKEKTGRFECSEQSPAILG